MDRSPEPEPRLRVTDEHDGRLRVWRISAPPGNILDLALVKALRAELAGTVRRAPHALLIEAEGPNFSYGASIKDHRRDRIGPFLSEFHAFVREFLAAALPTVAVVQGRCLGGGLELALLAQRIVSAPDASLGTPEVELGVFAPVASLLLPSRVLQPFADRLLTTGRPVAAAEAEAHGLVDEIAADPGAAARRFVVAEWLSKSRSALRHAASAARFELVDRVERLLGAVERRYRGDLMATPDANEGIAAFLARRPPSWKAAGAAATTDYWQTRWQAGRTGWHRDLPQPWLVAQRDELLAPPRGRDGGRSPAPRVLVPLCGKSVDLEWLVAQGASVVGVDVAPQARDELARSRGLAFAPRPGVAPPYDVEAAGALEFWCGDLFALDPVRHGRFGAAFDRAALVALPRERRAAYARTIAAALEPGGRLLLVGLEFTGPSELGPPFSVPRDEAVATFTAAGLVAGALVGERLLLEEREFWAARGVADAREYAQWFERPISDAAARPT
jgi:cyclohexa-1,5-dienecarbonyl-CoA hydratase